MVTPIYSAFPSFCPIFAHCPVQGQLCLARANSQPRPQQSDSDGLRRYPFVQTAWDKVRLEVEPGSEAKTGSSQVPSVHNARVWCLSHHSSCPQMGQTKKWCRTSLFSKEDYVDNNARRCFYKWHNVECWNLHSSMITSKVVRYPVVYFPSQNMFSTSRLLFGWHQMVSMVDKNTCLHHLSTSSQVDLHDYQGVDVKSSLKLTSCILRCLCEVVLPVLASSSTTIPFCRMHCQIVMLGLSRCDHLDNYNHRNCPLLPFSATNGSNPGK